MFTVLSSPRREHEQARHGDAHVYSRAAAAAGGRGCARRRRRAAAARSGRRSRRRAAAGRRARLAQASPSPTAPLVGAEAEGGGAVARRDVEADDAPPPPSRSPRDRCTWRPKASRGTARSGAASSSRRRRRRRSRVAVGAHPCGGTHGTRPPSASSRGSRRRPSTRRGGEAGSPCHAIDAAPLVDVGEVAEQRARTEEEEVGALRVRAEVVEERDGVERGAVVVELALVAPLRLAVDREVPVPPRRAAVRPVRHVTRVREDRAHRLVGGGVVAVPQQPRVDLLVPSSPGTSSGKGILSHFAIRRSTISRSGAASAASPASASRRTNAATSPPSGPTATSAPLAAFHIAAAVAA